MRIYERNFDRLLRLVPELASLPCSVVSLGPVGRRLEVEIVERHKFTTVIRVSQKMPIAFGPAASTAMTVRVYHDARVAEVLTYQHHRRFQPKYDYPNVEMLQVREKRRVNEFLGEWLDSCIIQERLAFQTSSGLA